MALPGSMLASSFLCILAQVQAAPAREGGASSEEHLVVVHGCVLAPGGGAAEGAVVVSSAGGRAVADRGGNFSLALRVPRAAESVQLTAEDASGANLVARASVARPSWARSASVSLDRLRLGPSGACEPRWLPTFGAPPGANDFVQAQAVYDDGDGPALYIGGRFYNAGGVSTSRVARWDGVRWSALGSDVLNDMVETLAVHDDGSGPALFAGGSFTTAGSLTVNRIARWNGSSWSALGTGMNGLVLALAEFDDGSGPALYAGGTFNQAGGVPAFRVARWDGTSWSPVGSGLTGLVNALCVYDDGGGPALYAGGTFTTVGGSRIARWDGTSWSALGSGLNGDVLALGVHDDGGGP